MDRVAWTARLTASVLLQPVSRHPLHGGEVSGSMRLRLIREVLFFSTAHTAKTWTAFWNRNRLSSQDGRQPRRRGRLRVLAVHDTDSAGSITT